MPLTFRSSRIVYYGPHPCDNCGAMIAKMGREWGGNAFDYPEGPIYPNTEWHPHVCQKRSPQPLPPPPPPPPDPPEVQSSYLHSGSCAKCPECGGQKFVDEAHTPSCSQLQKPYKPLSCVECGCIAHDGTIYHSFDCPLR